MVYENENGTIAPHHISIRNEERTKESSCIESGNKFCLVAIMGECEGWWCVNISAQPEFDFFVIGIEAHGEVE